MVARNMFAWHDCGMNPDAHPLRIARTRAGLTQQQLADRIQCVKQDAISCYENWVKLPSLETAQIIAAIPELELTELHLLYPERFVSAESAA